ncbi:MAG: hypothetical protein CL878_14205 [Dehalococcoidia bacterium]|nr:hypothetical protein [Dehalococcoidia bacterium]
MAQLESASPAATASARRLALLPGLPLFYQLMLANLMVVLVGAIVGTSLTRRFVEDGTFTPWVHVLMVVAAVLLSVVFTTLILYAAFRPVRSLRRAIAQYRAGDSVPRAQVELHGDPDLQAVVQALNSLWSRLSEHQRQLERTNARLAEKNREMQRLAAQVIEAQEEERRRVARELHDDTMQSLAAISVGLEHGLQAMPAEIPRFRESHHVVARLQRLAEDTLDNLRKLALALRPSVRDDHGLVAAVRWLAATHEEHHGMPVRVRIDGERVEDRLSPPVETAIFRIVQEALSNVAKHSNADSVLVRLRVDEHLLTAEVADNGVGIDERLLALTATEQTVESANQASPVVVSASRRPPLGLFGMRERAVLLDGELAVQRRTDGHSGTLMRVTIPRSTDTAALEDMT